MRKGLLLTVGSWLTGAGLALAQGTTPTPTPTPVPSAEKVIVPPGAVMPDTVPLPGLPGADHLTPKPVGGPGCDGCMPPCCPPSGPRFWATGEYLLWWIKGAPVPPLATLVTPANAAAAVAAGQAPGAIGSIGTQVLNSSTLDFEPFSGGRATVGMWLNDDHSLGAELSGFLLQRRSASFAFSDNVAAVPGGPILSVPFVNPLAVPPAETATGFGLPGLSNGQAFATSSLRLWGAEGDGLLNVIDNDSFRLSLLAGGRYLDLSEDLNIGFNAFVPRIGDFTNFSVSRQDRFSTRNQFYGGQLGLRGVVQAGAFYASLTGKVALGDMHESVNANGQTTIVQPAPLFVGVPAGTTSFPGGFFAQPSNIGRRTRDVFSVIPETTLQVGVNLGNNMSAFVGYDFLFISNVVRPGEQIDRSINLSQQFGAPLVGPAAPLPRFTNSDFWAHGITAGFTLRF